MSIRSLILIAAALGLSAPALADPPSWAPAHGKRAKHEREYRYVYYPAQQVYYSPEKQVWFYMNGGNWQVGVNLPSQFRISVADGLQLTLGAERPYVQHAYVEQEYGRPWREKHGHQHGHNKGGKQGHDKGHDKGHGKDHDHEKGKGNGKHKD